MSQCLDTQGVGGHTLKRKRTPPSDFLVERLDNVGPGTRAEIQREILSVLNEVRYAGDVKTLAERYGLHYLKSKRMRVRELRQWIIDNHPALKEVKKPERLIGVDWAGVRDRTVISIAEVQSDGSLKFEIAEDSDGE